jgi:hypothetical protein
MKEVWGNKLPRTLTQALRRKINEFSGIASPIYTISIFTTIFRVASFGRSGEIDGQTDCQVHPLLSNGREISNCTTAVAK